MDENWIAVFDSQEMEISRHFARFMLNLAGERCPELFLAAGLVSRYTEEGNVCLHLPLIAGRPVAEVLDGTEDSGEDAGGEAHCPELPHWIDTLRRISVVGQPGEFKPLILDDRGRLYLYRYWEYEKIVAESLTERAAMLWPDLDEALLQDGIRRLFPDPAGKNENDGTSEPDNTNEPDWQKIAAMTAVRRMFCVISGGPGAGKTSTVVKVLALLLEQARGKALRMAMAAPTGKAAARLKESIRQTKGNLACSPEIRSLIPDEVSTIHRLLGTIRLSSFFRGREENVLPYDVVVVDEASMVDLPLMARLVRAVPQRSRLIILGDKDQLASVEAGAVLGDICGTGLGHIPMVLHSHPAAGPAATGDDCHKGEGNGPDHASGGAASSEHAAGGVASADMTMISAYPEGGRNVDRFEICPHSFHPSQEKDRAYKCRFLRRLPFQTSLPWGEGLREGDIHKRDVYVTSHPHPASPLKGEGYSGASTVTGNPCLKEEEYERLQVQCVNQKPTLVREGRGRSLRDSLVLLRKSYRFGSDSGIGLVSRLINEGEGESALSLLKGTKRFRGPNGFKSLTGIKRPIGGGIRGGVGDGNDVGDSSSGYDGNDVCGSGGVGVGEGEGAGDGEGYRDISWRRCPSPAVVPEAIAERITQEYSDYLKVDDPEEAFRHFNRFRILCALRRGPYGADRVNALIEEALHRAGLIQISGSVRTRANLRGHHYRGQPVIITRNDYRIGLFNGDVGLILPDPSASGALSVYFPTSDGAMRKIPPVRLPEHESVYAMTVHKSQGSEFDRVLFLLPDMDAEILTRELIYTSITRARDYVEVWGREEVFLKAISRRIQRQSGLQEALWG